MRYASWKNSSIIVWNLKYAEQTFLSIRPLFVLFLQSESLPIGFSNVTLKSLWIFLEIGKTGKETFLETNHYSRVLGSIMIILWQQTASKQICIETPINNLFCIFHFFEKKKLNFMKKTQKSFDCFRLKRNWLWTFFVENKIFFYFCNLGFSIFNITQSLFKIIIGNCKKKNFLRAFLFQWDFPQLV